ncbi:peptidase C14, caspase catalytic subunit p20 [Rhodobacterales bacterium 56_14_T64]|nr:peptidase C14, caspase catalytic subunit p20 [Rhodobacterales bacterium 56_14_T64]
MTYQGDPPTSGCLSMITVVAAMTGLGFAASADTTTSTQSTAVFEKPISSGATDIAIVVGIQNYTHVSDLTNTLQDAQAMSAMLKSFGYTVYEGYDLDKRGFETLLRQAALNIRVGGQVFFYYAGHGIQLGRRNYLLTSDAALTDIHDLPFQSVTLDRISAILGGKANSQILMLDSCRDNPVPDIKVTADIGADLFEAREGFDVFRPPLNTLVAFSTSPGATALDGEPGSNSPYTASVIRQFPANPQEDAITVLSAVRSEVYKLTDSAQITWESSTLTEKLFVRPITQVVDVKQNDGPQRGLSLVEIPQALTISAPLGRSLELAPEILPFLSPGTEVSITTRPQSGVSSIEHSAGGPLSLSYTPELAEISSQNASDTNRSDSMVLRLAQGEIERDITLNLDIRVSDCDLQAGDLLDLQGVGLYRFPNEIDVTAAEKSCHQAIENAPEIGRFQYQLGRALQGQTRLTDAYQAFQTAAVLGHVRAYNALAYLMITPNIDRATVAIPLDPETANALWEKGIIAGDPFSMHARGKRLLHSSTSEDDRRRGFELLSRAVELGHTYSLNELGVFYLWGPEELAQPKRGLSYLKASAERGDIYGMANLGFAHRDGIAGLAKDPKVARDFFAQASELGHPSAPAEIARMIMKGDLPGSDAVEALSWNDMGLERGDAWAGTNGAWIAFNRLSSRIPLHSAVARAGKAMALNNEEAAVAAQRLLNDLSNSDIDAGTQAILKALGGNVITDGQFGPASRRAMNDAAAKAGLTPQTPSNAIDRLRFAAQIHWALNPIRQDLF